jgi:ABC-type nitrate/sulfonate/bicarbonate transport system permease component
VARLPAVARHATLTRALVILVLFGIWEVVARGFVDPSFMSPPSLVIASLGELFATPGVNQALITTFLELAAAFALSVAVGLAAGFLVGLHGFSRRSLLPIVLLLYATPQVTILPLFILYFGIGPASKIAFGMSHGMFPIIVTVAAGVQNIKSVLLLSARSMGASPRQILRWVIFPHMIPSFFTGMRLGMTAALLGVLLAELYVSSAGVGQFTHTFADSFEPTKLFGLISVLALMAIVLNEIVRRAEVRFGHWQST